MTFQLIYKRLYFDTQRYETCNDIWMSTHIFIGSRHKPYRREVMNMEVKE